jgi:serine/threonine protein kinase
MNSIIPQILINNTYLIVEKVGEGGFGEVYKAVDLSFRSLVAIKKLFRNYADNINFVSMFYKEASIAKTLVHDNIVRVSHFWVDENSKEFYILMDYVNGKSLEYIINKCRKQNIKMPFEVVWYVAVNLAKVLHYLHMGAKHPITDELYNLVYMDLSPGNVLISFDGKIKITDFGVTRTKQSIEQDRRVIIAGKYAYMSPEQILGEKIDFRTDIFSLGVVLYEMLTYEEFLKKDVNEIKEIITQAKFDFEKLKDINVPQEFISILEKTLKKNKEERYSSALEMYRDLRALFKEKFEEDIESNFVEFLNNTLNEEKQIEKEKQDKIFSDIFEGDIKKILENPLIEKVNCIDFIPGTTTQVLSKAKTEQKEQQLQQIPEEEKGKTIFEEVGNWLIQKIKLYRKRITRVVVSFFIALILFLLIDTFIVPGHITIYGKKIYSYLFPPDVIISLTPPKGKVTVTSRKTQKVIYSGYYFSPIELRNLLPGSYEIVAEEENLPTIRRVISISEDIKSKKQTIELTYTVNIAVYSDPSNATILINGTKVGKTPWVGESLAEKIAIQLEYSNFEPLGSIGKEEKKGRCIVDFTQTSEDRIFKDVDKDFWVVKSSNLAYRGLTYILFGNIPKKINVNSEPKDVIVFLNDKQQAEGTTPVSLLLPKGKHKISFKPSPPYLPTELEINVTEDSPINYYVELKKNIIIYAYDKKTKTPLKAKFNIINTDIKGVTPSTISILPKTYKISFLDLEGKYISETFVFDLKSVDKVSAYLELKKPKVSFVVLNANDKAPIENAYIWIDMQIVGKTEKTGKFTTEVSEGERNIKVIADGFDIYTTTVTLSAAQEKTIEVYLYPSVIKCPKCGAEYPSNTQFDYCIKCGTKLPKPQK